MKIVMFAINPLYPDQVLGGAPKHLHNVAVHLGELGHQVRVYCTQDESPIPFNWHANVTVLPQLRFSLPFPLPYDIPAYHFANAIADIAGDLRDAERFYMHDGELLFAPITSHAPSVVSLRDNVYPETMVGAFNFTGDALIAISQYSAATYSATAGRFYPDWGERLHVVNNGLDWERFRPMQPERIFEYVSVDPAQHAILLHPHRPEPSKGLERTIAVADRLIKTHGIDNLRVLTPRWVDSATSSEVTAYLDKLRRMIKERGIEEHFVFHGWIPQSLMHEYYNLGDVLLAPGHFAEAFGNVPYESLGCGTPAIVARVSTHRSLLPDALIDKVHYGDDETMAAIAADIIKTGRRTSPETMAYLHEHYGIAAQLAAYADIILNTQKRGPLAYRFTPQTADTRYVLAPWCYTWNGNVFHDYKAEHTLMPDLVRLVTEHPGGFTVGVAEPGAVDAWYREGYIVPEYFNQI
ncbi:MAG: glycosyltransferase family 4 protein [Chloroflexi bacterium]|nr:glycosyltransferase family 4 protein [Chloroflexota bacterium]